MPLIGDYSSQKFSISNTLYHGEIATPETYNLNQQGLRFTNYIKSIHSMPPFPCPGDDHSKQNKEVKQTGSSDNKRSVHLG